VSSSAWLAVLVLCVLAAGATLLWFRAEGGAPVVSAPESVLVGKPGAALAIGISDDGTGLRELKVGFVRGEAETLLLEEAYPGNLVSGGVRAEHEASLSLDAARLGGPGAGVLRVAARDWSWRGWFGGNQTIVELPLTVDLDPPRVQIETGLSYVAQGGAGAVAYRISEPAASDGVRVGEHVYRGFPRPGGAEGERVALYAVAPDADPGVVPLVVATDAAGNESSARWPVVVKARPMPEGNVTLPGSFLTDVVPRLGGGGSDAAAFHDVNTRLRADNEAKIRALLAESPEPAPLFDGQLQQLANSQVTSRFAERRTYFVDGAEVSHAVHYGYDLAATAATAITAAAAGRVVYAGDLGIYGNCVLLDHGLGLATLYGHLSRIEVAAGDRVEQGARLGASGSTGLAGGDHLHFAVLVGDTYVDPVEWWDAAWVDSHVTARLSPPAP
jgi:murein DD-endopeptidase MepM/ murein hydrolase activator NlpD